MSICSKREKCRPAQLCYYDLLDPETAESVPDDVHEHVASCADCRSDIDRLRDTLASAGKRVDSEQRRRDSAITELLSLHFAWVDELVTCTQVKPFLPGLADPLLRVRVPTPITAHVDNCPACSKELAALRDAALTHTQLCRLSRILADDLDEDTDSQEVRAVFPPVADMLERADSGIATRFTLSEPAESNPGELQTSRLIEVEVIDRQQAAAANWQLKVIRSLKLYRRPAMAVAAVLLVGLALFFATPTVGAVNVEHVFKALKDAGNIHATFFNAGKTEPERERWISRPLKKYMVRAGQEWTLWDLREDSRTFKRSQDARPEAVPFTPLELATAKSKLDDPRGITPGKTPSDLPADALWEKVPEHALPPGTQSREVYDLTWTDRISGPEVMRRWRVFMDPAGNRPRKVQYSDKLPAEPEYTPRRHCTLEYPSDAGMRAEIERAFP